MNLVLLSGGSGKRLWPLSNDRRSKQFIKLFKTEQGYESMVQRIYGQIKAADPNATVTVATGKTQVSAIHNQLGDAVNVCVEPCRRDTFPAIALAAAFLRYKKGFDENTAVVVCPVDPYVEEEYFQTLARLCDRAEKSDANLVLMGIEPTYPSEKFGYVIPETDGELSRVKTFKEKPDTETAKEYIAQGAMWNGGVFAFKIGYLLKKAHELLEFTDYDDLLAGYEKMPKISFDYAVAEREEKIEIMRFSGQWKDLGTWNALTAAMDESTAGNVILDESCENVYAINELNTPLLCMGMKDCVVAVSSDGILVTSRERSDFIKPYVDKIHGETMFAEKSWGTYRVIDIQDDSMTVFVTLKAGEQMTYHSHERRDEIWTVISGDGTATVDGREKPLTVGDVISVPAGSRHSVAAKSEMKLIEVQIGDNIDVHDKIKY